MSWLSEYGEVGDRGESGVVRPPLAEDREKTDELTVSLSDGVRGGSNVKLLGDGLK